MEKVAGCLHTSNLDADLTSNANEEREAFRVYCYLPWVHSVLQGDTMAIFMPVRKFYSECEEHLNLMNRACTGIKVRKRDL